MREGVGHTVEALAADSSAADSPTSEALAADSPTADSSAAEALAAEEAGAARL